MVLNSCRVKTWQLLFAFCFQYRVDKWFPLCQPYNCPPDNITMPLIGTFPYLQQKHWKTCYTKHTRLPNTLPNFLRCPGLQALNNENHALSEVVTFSGQLQSNNRRQHINQMLEEIYTSLIACSSMKLRN